MRGRGVTLIELLVAMLIMGFVMALVSQSMYQVSKLVDATESTQRQLGTRWAAGWSLGSLFGNLVAPQEARAQAFQGDAARLEGYSTAAVLSSEAQGVEQFVLRLQRSPGKAAGSELVMASRLSLAEAYAPEQVVGVFDAPVEFAYRDRTGQWRASWPLQGGLADGAVAEPLPSAVVVREVGRGRIFIAYPVLASETAQRISVGGPFGDKPP
jgi:prepilin-type N-terminal cleavage/methylation domain-containing protein